MVDIMINENKMIDLCIYRIKNADMNTTHICVFILITFIIAFLYCHALPDLHLLALALLQNKWMAGAS